MSKISFILIMLVAFISDVNANPFLWPRLDSDNDGINDWSEHTSGTDRLDVTSPNQSPVITSSADFSVLENTTTVGQITTIDYNNNELSYTLSGEDESLFSFAITTSTTNVINSVTGQSMEKDVTIASLSLNEAKDYELEFDYIYSLEIAVEDGGGLGDSQEITVQLINDILEDEDNDGLTEIQEAQNGTNRLDPDSDDDGYTDGDEVENGWDPLNPYDPNAYPVITSANSFEVLENNLIVGTIQAEDPNGDALSYSLFGTDASLFTISTSGNIVFNQLPDYENDPSSYSINVRVDDNNGGLVSQGLSVVLTDDRTEDFDGDGLTESQEEDTYGTSDSDSDSDNDQLDDYQEVIVYGTNPNSEDTDSDQLDDNSEINRGTDPNNRDSDADGLTDGEEVNIYNTNPLLDDDKDSDGITDADEVNSGTDHNDITDPNQSPIITSTNTFVGIENTNTIFIVSATDINGDTPIYNLTGGDSSFFSINSSAGQILFNELPDYESKSSYSMTLEVSDGRGLLAIQPVVITITDDRTEDFDGDGLTEAQEEDGDYGFIMSDLDADMDDDGLSDFEEVIGIITNVSVESSYEFIPRSHFDQKFADNPIYSQRFNWFRAQQDAEERGGHLATVTSSEEWDTIRALFVGEFENTAAYLGGIRKDNNGDGNPDIGTYDPQNPLAEKAGSENWEWVTGEPWTVEFWYEYLYYGDFSSRLACMGTEFRDNWVQPNTANSYTKGGISGQSNTVSGYILEIDTMTTTNNINTNPLKLDTDDDGLTDYEEVMTYPTDPLIADTDDEGLLDGQEINIYNTDPLVVDTDGDGLTDYEEVVGHSTNPLLDADKDGDGLTDANEVLNIGTDPSIMDTDGDGLSDGDEVAMNGMTLSFDPATHSSNVISSIQGMISSTPSILNQSNSLMRTGGDELNINIRLQSSQDLIDGASSTNWSTHTMSISNNVDFIRIYKYD